MTDQQPPALAGASSGEACGGWGLSPDAALQVVWPSYGIPLLTATADGVITHGNEAAVRFFGQQCALVGRRLGELLHIDIPAHVSGQMVPDPVSLEGNCGNAQGHEVAVKVVLLQPAADLQALIMPLASCGAGRPPGSTCFDLYQILCTMPQEAAGITTRDALLQLICERLAACTCLQAACVVHIPDGRLLHEAGALPPASLHSIIRQLAERPPVSDQGILNPSDSAVRDPCPELARSGGHGLFLGEAEWLLLFFADHLDEGEKFECSHCIALTCRAMLERLAIGQHRLQLEEALQQAEASYQSLFALMPTPVFLYDVANLRLLDANEAFLTQYGYSRADLNELSARDILTPELSHAFDGLDAAADPALHLPRIVRHRRKDGSLFWAEVARRSVTVMGRPCLLCSVRDVTERMNNEAELELAAQVFHSSQDAIVILDAQQRILRVNQTFMDSTGYDAEALRHRCLEDLGWRMGDAGGPELGVVWEQLQTVPHWAGEWWATRVSGEHFPEWARVSRLVDERGHTTHYIVMLTDLSERREQERRLMELQMCDHLTGLPNREGFVQALRQAIEKQQALPLPTAVGVLCLDIDRFKTINDSLGAASGDELLRQIAKRLCRLLRDGDVVARPGGDEFYVLLAEVTDQRAAAAVSGRILASFQDPFNCAGEEIVISPSIGVSLYPRDGQDPAGLLRQAEAAMYQAKSQGGNQQLLYSAALHKGTSERLQRENDLRRALPNGELFLLYQPQVNIVNGQVVATEALLRWLHPRLGLISPAEFIPIAEETGLIVPIGEWVLRQACLQNVRWQRQHGRRIPVGVNLSAVQFRRQDVVTLVQRALEESGLDPAYLELELTEGTVMMDVERAIKVMKELKRIGVQLAIDDFGTGYSSLAYLKRFPIDTLKVDQSFIRDIASSVSDAEIARTIVQLAHGLGLRVVAEGVETMEQLLFLKEQRCHHIQGFFYSPPVTHDEIGARLRLQPLRA